MNWNRTYHQNGGFTIWVSDCGWLIEREHDKNCQPTSERTLYRPDRTKVETFNSLQKAKRYAEQFAEIERQADDGEEIVRWELSET